MGLRGGNPFSEDTTFTRVTGTPRIRITEINETNVVLAVEVVDTQGNTVLTFNRACLRVGDTLKLNSLGIDLSINIKE